MMNFCKRGKYLFSYYVIVLEDMIENGRIREMTKEKGGSKSYSAINGEGPFTKGFYDNIILKPSSGYFSLTSAPGVIWSRYIFLLEYLD